MADGSWSQSGCSPARTDVWWYGVPGQGSHYWTARFGQYWVSGGLHQRYAEENYECGRLGAPVKAYGWLSEFGAYGMWFEFGAIYYRDGAWRVAIGNYGQTVGRLTEVPELAPEPPEDAEVPSDGPADLPDDVPPPPDQGEAE